MRQFLAMMMAASVALAQSPSEPSPPTSEAAFSQQELDQMLAPIALYPDELLSQVLMASTYPLEVVEAARWSKANPGLRGDAAVVAVAAQPWDASVKSLVAFPEILDKMDQQLEWTERLGDAFLGQQAQVMDTVQALRRRAYDASNLRSTDQMRVSDDQGTISIEPAYPTIIYVPYYDPLAVYGPWWEPAYPPVYWPPWPGYYLPTPTGFAWGIGIVVSAGFFFGTFDWHRHHARVSNAGNFYYHRGRVDSPPGAWEHNRVHRRGVPYRGATLQQRFGRTGSAPFSGQRRDFRGYQSPTPGSAAPHQGRPQMPGGAPPQGRGPAGGAPQQRPGPPQRPGVHEPPPGAFEGIHRGGAQTRQFSTRGQGSLQPRPVPQHPSPKSGTAPATGGRPAPHSGAAQGGRGSPAQQRR
jgi:hypothetical protein